MSGSTVSVVDVSALSLENEDFDLENISEAVDVQLLGSRLNSALQQNGFVYIAGHGVDQQLVQQVGRMLKINVLWLKMSFTLINRGKGS